MPDKMLVFSNSSFRSAFKLGLTLDGAAAKNWSDAAAWDSALPERVPNSVADRRRLRTRTRDQNGLLFISIILPEMLVLRMYSSTNVYPCIFRCYPIFAMMPVRGEDREF
jgi:hypothetical protein